MDGRTDGQADGRTGGPTDGPTDGRTDRQTLIYRCVDASKKNRSESGEDKKRTTDSAGGSEQDLTDSEKGQKMWKQYYFKTNETCTVTRRARY